ncbi:hypothetical protein SAMN02746089_00351 [Caldanaerobius fijiensis DSM 17918]|uniref:Uncharacterized protein n=1 Tax=Caldanaerobius fijiensis DSM 17918 TaxID=1121256 RepID=A0A1M4U0X4_9THEO|nr:hypothetical protein [Caldanaerobius fijiensis]SHE50388.1 hypothetical protein SAMN02746089_00351 [Caldanaerobius fijiensis DSM 17918]
MDGKLLRGMILGGLVTYLAERGLKKMNKGIKRDMAEKAFNAIRKMAKV